MKQRQKGNARKYLSTQIRKTSHSQLTKLVLKNAAKRLDFILRYKSVILLYS